MARKTHLDDTRRFRLAVRGPDGLLMFDPMPYKGQSCADRQARTIRRLTGAEVQVRPA